MADRKRKGKAVAQSSKEMPRFKTLFHEAHYKGKLSARKVLPELIIQYNDEILSERAVQIKMRKWEKFTAPLQALGHNLEGRPTRIIGFKRCWKVYALREENGFIYSSYHQPFRINYGESCAYHSIIIGENINVEEIIANQIYKFVYKIDLSSSIPFLGIIAALCLDSKVTTLKDDTLINQELPIVGEAMVRTREARARNPRQARQEAPPQQQPPQEQPQPQVYQQQEFPSNFYTHFDASMSQIYRRLDQ
ncbi:hypothetical protein PIB30_048790 [Stylosanthes scabra]|uniref:Uncharacterized protein n=1 Tax=Stylosanthes scabra TaxID=79078 RepID=A0ABU6WFK4_9FABA|nr:hypothetical protein [Stylosanthes scabra]